MSQPMRILLALFAGLAIGIGLATVEPGWAEAGSAVAQPIGTMWLNALRMTIVPLVVALLGGAKVAATAPAAPTAAVATAGDAASVVIENEKAIFYFASGKAEPHADGAGALARIVDGVKAGKKAAISGYVDSTGSAAANAEIAKQRALAVRDLLMGLGVAEDQVELQKPADIQAGSGAQARRVEVVLM